MDAGRPADRGPRPDVDRGLAGQVRGVPVPAGVPVGVPVLPGLARLLTRVSGVVAWSKLGSAGAQARPLDGVVFSGGETTRQIALGAAMAPSARSSASASACAPPALPAAWRSCWASSIGVGIDVKATQRQLRGRGRAVSAGEAGW